MKTLTVLCPVYNEEEVIPIFYAELRRVLETLDGYQSSMMFVVDRCTDRTLAVLKQIADRDPSVMVIGLASRFGHQMSLLAGIDYCDTDIVIMMDSDMQHPPSLIPRLLEEYERGYEIVYTIREDTSEINIFKRISSKLFYRAVNYISDIPISESAADFRLVSRRVVRLFQTQIRERNQFLRGLFSWVGFKNTAVPFTVQKRGAGRSKYSIRRMLRFGVQGTISFSKRPLQAATIAGFLFAITGFVLALITMIQFFAWRSFPPGWTTLTTLLLVFSGIQLIFLGIIGEYIGAIFDEVKARPHYIVEEIVNVDRKAQNDESLYRL